MHVSGAHSELDEKKKFSIHFYDAGLFIAFFRVVCVKLTSYERVKIKGLESFATELLFMNYLGVEMEDREASFLKSSSQPMSSYTTFESTHKALEGNKQEMIHLL